MASPALAQAGAAASSFNGRAVRAQARAPAARSAAQPAFFVEAKAVRALRRARSAATPAGASVRARRCATRGEGVEGALQRPANADAAAAHALETLRSNAQAQCAASAEPRWRSDAGCTALTSSLAVRVREARRRRFEVSLSSRGADTQAPSHDHSSVRPLAPPHPLCHGLAQSNRYKKKLRVKFRSYNVKAIEKAVDTLLDLAEEHDTDVSGPVPLPTKIRRFCLLRSPHVNKDSREHFEVRTHSRLVDLMEPEAGIIDGLMTLELPPGVDPEISVIEARA